MVELESADVEYWVDFQLGREVEFVCIVVDDTLDLERAKVLVGQLRGSLLGS